MLRDPTSALSQLITTEEDKEGNKGKGKGQRRREELLELARDAYLKREVEGE